MFVHRCKSSFNSSPTEHFLWEGLGREEFDNPLVIARTGEQKSTCAKELCKASRFDWRKSLHWRRTFQSEQTEQTEQELSAEKDESVLMSALRDS